MLRLWPEKLSLCLLSEGAWLRSGTTLHKALPGNGDLLQQLTGMAQQLLPAPVARRGFRPVLDVVLSDDVGRLLPLPWQPRLRNSEQQRRYAEICFEAEGVGAADWVVQAAYRRFGAAGMGLAVRRDVLASLLEIADMRALRLRSALPIAGAAYWRHRWPGKAGEVLVLDEGRRFTALVFVMGTLTTIDVQPVGENRGLALTQLMRRCQTETNSLTYWNGGAMPLPDEVLASACPAAVIRRLTQEVWG